MRFDISAGLLVGVALGLMFSPVLGPHTNVLIALALIVGAKIISLK